MSNLEDFDHTGPSQAASRLAERVLRQAGTDPADWVPHQSGTDWDVAIIGGGQSGQAIAFALRRAGITRVTILEAAEKGQAGLWRTSARMDFLRTPKAIPRPELDIGGLGFRAWYEATH